MLFSSIPQLPAFFPHVRPGRFRTQLRSNILRPARPARNDQFGPLACCSRFVWLGGRERWRGSPRGDGQRARIRPGVFACAWSATSFLMRLIEMSGVLIILITHI